MPTMFKAFLKLALIGAFSIQIAVFLSKKWWFFELFSHYSHYYAAIALIFTGIHLVQKNFVGALLWVSLLSINGSSFAPYLQASKSMTNETDSSVNELSLNIYAQNAYYLNMDTSEFYEEVLVLQPDLFIVHEAHAGWGSTQNEVLTDYPYTKLTEETGVHGIFMGSQIPGQFTEIPLGEEVGLEFIPLDNSYKILAVHPQAPVKQKWASERNEQFADIITYVQNSSVPVVVIGDFNCTPWSPYFVDLLEQTALKDARLLDPNPGLDFTWNASSFLFQLPIDHALVSKEWEVLNFETRPTQNSDHKGIWTKLNLEN